MKKLLLLVTGFSIFFTAPSPVSAGWTSDDIGIQRINQDIVPHINQNGQIQHTYNEKSFFPLVLYFTDMGKIGQPWTKYNLNDSKSRDTLSEVSQAGFNTSWPSTFTPTNAELDHAQKYGIKIIANLSNEIATLLSNYTPSNIALFKTTIARLRDHKAIIGYHLYDEFPPYSSEQYLEIKNLIRTVDPQKIVFANHYQQGCTTLFDDISNFDVYPFKSNLPTLSLLQTGLAIDNTIKSGCPRPIWVIIQSFKDVNHKWRMPNPAEMRGQIYTSIVHGATGIYAFMQHSPWAWNGNRPGQGYLEDREYLSGISPQINPDLWQTMSKINHEIITHQAILLSPTSKEPYRMMKSTKASIHSMLKDTPDQNVRYLIAVNTSITPTTEKFIFNAKLFNVTSVLDNRQLPPTNNEFMDKFEGYGVRIYKLDYSSTTEPSPSIQPSITPSARVADLNRDGKVNILDYSFFVSQFGKTGVPYFTTADINGDGKVNLIDYNLFMTDYKK